MREHGFGHGNTNCPGTERLVSREESLHGFDLARMKGLGLFAQSRGDGVNKLRQRQGLLVGARRHADKLLRVFLLLRVMLRRQLLKRLDPGRCGWRG